MENLTSSRYLAFERNVEIKARIETDKGLEERVDIARKLTAADGNQSSQEDVFFNSKNGYLKLRYSLGDTQLIYYERPNIPGPKLKLYNRITVDEPKVLEKMLDIATGIKGIVSKKRHFFQYNNVRIHIDKVECLGFFVEFEVCLEPEQNFEQGCKVIIEMMEQFQITYNDLEGRSYLDLLLRRNS